jgi:hypothetical protein
MHFVVALPEAGDVEAMKEMLTAQPEHAKELLFGARSGVDGGSYSVWGYTTWLCTFDAHREDAQRVLHWLISCGHSPDLWSAIALDDAAGLRAMLEPKPAQAQEKHPLFAMVPSSWRR